MTSTGAHDVVIAGGGVVGATLAAALADAGLRVIVVAPEAVASDGDRPDAAARAVTRRPIALALPAREALRRLGFISADDGTAIETIHVSQQGGFGRTVLRASDHRLPALGFVFDGAMLDAAAVRVGATWQRPGRVLAWHAHADHVAVEVAADHVAPVRLEARLLVLADGGTIAGLETTRDYRQVAWCGTACTSPGHRNIAWERFTPDGPLALLPFEDRHAFVWARRADACATTPEDDEDFCKALHAAFGGRLGHFHDVSERFRVPLALKRRTSISGPRTIAIGNASQTLHPVAGQGLNLGLRDALALAAHLRRHRHDDIGGTDLTQAFARARAIDRVATIGTTDGLVRLFSNDDPLWSFARGLGLIALDACAPARAFLARRMMLGARGFP